MSSSRSRGFPFLTLGIRLTTWPHLLAKLLAADITDNEKVSIIYALFDATPKEQDSYAEGLIEMFETPEKMLECMKELTNILQCDFNAMFYSIDFIERLNSLLTIAIQKRAPGGAAAQQFREHKLAQSKIVQGSYDAPVPDAPYAIAIGNRFTSTHISALDVAP